MTDLLPYDQLPTAALDALTSALERMDRARAILTDGNPRPECNWGMLGTSDIRAALAAQRTGNTP